MIATLGTAVPSAVEIAGPERLSGKVLIDVTNPLEFHEGGPPHPGRCRGRLGG